MLRSFGSSMPETIGPADHHIGRMVIGIRGLHDVVAGNGAHDEVAAARAERIADEPDDLGEPDITHRDLEFLGEDLGDRVLESLFLLVRERKVSRIGADA
jgi:hypothetical protein